MDGSPMRLLAEVDPELLQKVKDKLVEVDPEFQIPYTVILSSVSSAILGGVMACLIAYRHLSGLVDLKLQTYIVRIVLIIPIIAMEVISVLFFKNWLPGVCLAFVVIRDLWEALVIDTFLSFILESAGGEMACARAMALEPGVVSHLPPVTWLLPEDGYNIKIRTQGTRFYAFQYIENAIECFRQGRDGDFPTVQYTSREPSSSQYSTYTVAKIVPCTPVFVKWCKRGTIQFVLTKPLMALLTVMIYFSGLSGKVWEFVELFVYNVSYSVALYSLCLFYTAIRHNPKLQPVKPLSKFVSVKMVVFATFWQNLFINTVAMINNIIYHSQIKVPQGIGSKVMTPEWVERFGAMILGYEIPLFAAAIAFSYPLDEFSRMLTGDESVRAASGANSQHQMEMGSMVELNTHRQIPAEKFSISDVAIELHADDDDEANTGRSNSITSTTSMPAYMPSNQTDSPTGVYRRECHSLDALDGPLLDRSLSEDSEEIRPKTKRGMSGLLDLIPGGQGMDWNSDKAKKVVMAGLKAPHKIGQTVVYGMVETTDQGKRDQAKKNFANVINISDVFDDVTVNFTGKYFDHSLIHGGAVKAEMQNDDEAFSEREEPLTGKYLMDVFEREDPFDLHSPSDGPPYSENISDYEVELSASPPPPPPGPPPPPADDDRNFFEGLSSPDSKLSFEVFIPRPEGSKE